LFNARNAKAKGLRVFYTARRADIRVDRSGALNQFGAMRKVSSVPSMQRLVLKWRRGGISIGFVPTMGYLHEGHLTLVRRARELVGPVGKVVVSIYVNPTQFGPAEDFTKYPRDLERDYALCRQEGVDVVFAPGDEQMYSRRSGDFSTYVVEDKLSKTMEGASRPTHFRGVTTVVAKLFNIVQPEVAVFGSKDYQQATVIRRMARDLNFPVRIVVARTHREPDGLAMSSRNKYLEGDLRRQATVLWRAIAQARKIVRASAVPVPAGRLKADLKRFIEREPAARVDYVEFFDPDTLEPAAEVAPGVHLAVAVLVGKTRLIDNGRIV
jgi:pantoate--beta-alanine ligase